MNIPALLHVVMGVEAIHSEQYDHMKILEKLIVLGADLSLKDVARRNFLHHCSALLL